jgi:hypothetical protein
MGMKLIVKMQILLVRFLKSNYMRSGNELFSNDE